MKLYITSQGNLACLPLAQHNSIAHNRWIHNSIHHGLLQRRQVSRLIPLHYWKEHGGWARPSWSRVCQCLSDQSDGMLQSMPTKLSLYLLQLFEIFQPGQLSTEWGKPTPKARCLDGKGRLSVLWSGCSLQHSGEKWCLAGVNNFFSKYESIFKSFQSGFCSH